MAKPRRAIQQELIEDARQVKEITRKLRNRLAPLCEAEDLAGANRLRANELLDEIQEMMAEAELTQLALPNGGKVIYSEKKKARYVAPKKSAVESDGDGDENDEE